MRFLRTIAARLALIGVLAAPVLEGALPVSKLTALLLSPAVAILGIVAWRAPRAERKQRALLLAVSFAVSLTAFDLAARPFRGTIHSQRPHEMFIVRWPEQPAVTRYVPNLRFVGPTYGDLAAMAGRREWREVRTIRWATDAAGFPNEADVAAAQSYDAVLLADSFGAGVEMTLAETWSHRLTREYGWRTYNMAVGGASPWDEYVNLALEWERLPLREGGTVIWALFGGNDLDDEYQDRLAPEELRVRNPLLQWEVRIANFQMHSVVGQMINRVRHRFLGRHERDVIVHEFLDGRPLLFFGRYRRRCPRPLAELEAHPHTPRLDATMAAMRRLVASRQARVLVVVVPAKEEIYRWVLEGRAPWTTSAEPSGFAQLVRRLATKHGFDYLDLKPRMVGAAREWWERERALLYWRDDTHWNPHGHRIAAAAVAEALSARLAAR